MNCEESKQNVHAWLDDELGPSAKLQLQHHLEECPNCSERFRAERKFDEHVRGALNAEQAPQRLHDSIREALQYEASRESSRLLRPWTAWQALAAAAALLLLAFLIWQGGDEEKTPDERLLRTSIAEHRLLRVPLPSVLKIPQLPLDVFSSDPDRINAELRHLVDFEVHVPDLSSQGWELRGGRVFRSQGHECRLVSAVYDSEHGRITCVICCKCLAQDPPFQVHEVNGRQYFIGEENGQCIVCWREQDAVCTLVSELPLPLLIELASALQ